MLMTFKMLQYLGGTYNPRIPQPTARAGTSLTFFSLLLHFSSMLQSILTMWDQLHTTVSAASWGKQYVRSKFWANISQIRTPISRISPTLLESNNLLNHEDPYWNECSKALQRGSAGSIRDMLAGKSHPSHSPADWDTAAGTFGISLSPAG